MHSVANEELKLTAFLSMNIFSDMVITNENVSIVTTVERLTTITIGTETIATEIETETVGALIKEGEFQTIVQMKNCDWILTAVLF